MSCLLVEMPADAVVLASWIDETKTRMSSISHMVSIVAVLGETYITIFILLFKVVQNVYVSWIFFGGLSLSQNNKVGGYPVEGGGCLTFCHKFVTLDPNNRHHMAIIDNS